MPTSLDVTTRAFRRNKRHGNSPALLQGLACEVSEVPCASLEHVRAPHGDFVRVESRRQLMEAANNRTVEHDVSTHQMQTVRSTYAGKVSLKRAVVGVAAAPAPALLPAPALACLDASGVAVGGTVLLSGSKGNSGSPYLRCTLAMGGRQQIRRVRGRGAMLYSTEPHVQSAQCHTEHNLLQPQAHVRPPPTRPHTCTTAIPA